VIANNTPRAFARLIAIHTSLVNTEKHRQQKPYVCIMLRLLYVCFCVFVCHKRASLLRPPARAHSASEREIAAAAATRQGSQQRVAPAWPKADHLA